MTRYRLTDEDKANLVLDGREAARMRRVAELALLNRLRAEAAMPEWYPER